ATVYNRTSTRAAMKKRYLYALLFGMPGFFIAGIVSLFVFGGTTGLLWIFLFGDDPWPTSADMVLIVLLAVVFLALWAASITAGYFVGMFLEADPTMNRKHILLSGGLTLLFILFIALQQLSVGNLGPRSDSALCSEFCARQGYAGSGVLGRDPSERTCSCYNSKGKEVLKVPMEEIEP
ncbi:MAG: hypothetical protein AB1649_25135, partial [Chloroflexota bacterium]